MDKDQYLADSILDIPLRVIVAAKLLRWLRARRIDKPVSVDLLEIYQYRLDLACKFSLYFGIPYTASIIELILSKVIQNHFFRKLNDRNTVIDLGITEVGFVPRAKK